jgi:hypothetical protein
MLMLFNANVSILYAVQCDFLTAVICSAESKSLSDPHDRLSEWRVGFPFCCTTWLCPVPSPCISNLICMRNSGKRFFGRSNA